MFLVIKAAIRELSGVSLSILPCNSTVAMMAYVLGVISDLQVGEVRYTQDNITLSWDSTSVDGHHINEIQVSLPADPPVSYVLQLGLPRRDNSRL